jgi:hypothetical protein
MTATIRLDGVGRDTGARGPWPTSTSTLLWALSA